MTSWTSARRRATWPRRSRVPPRTTRGCRRSRPRPRRPATAPGPASPRPTASRSPGPTRSAAGSRAYGLQTGQGVELTDTTTPAWDPATRRGRSPPTTPPRLKNETKLPGPLWVSQSTTITDPEAIAAQAYSHDIVEYYEALGRDSWDAEGGPLISSVHFGPPDYCNAFFAGFLAQPQMVYGNSCDINGQRANATFVEPDVAAHEVTHGVTADQCRAALHRPVRGAQRELLRLLRERDRQPGQGHGQRRPRRGRLRRDLPDHTALQPEPRRLGLAALHAQRQRLRRLPADPGPRPAADPAAELQAGLRRRALQLGDLEQRAVEHPHPAGPDRRAARQQARRWPRPSTRRCTARWRPG